MPERSQMQQKLEETLAYRERLLRTHQEVSVELERVHGRIATLQELLQEAPVEEPAPEPQEGPQLQPAFPEGTQP